MVLFLQPNMTPPRWLLLKFLTAVEPFTDFGEGAFSLTINVCDFLPAPILQSRGKSILKKIQITNGDY